MSRDNLKLVGSQLASVRVLPGKTACYLIYYF